MSEHTSDIVGHRIRGKHRVGVRGLKAGFAGEPVRRVIVEEVTPIVDRRRITADGDVIGSITFDSDTGEVHSWDISDKYRK